MQANDNGDRNAGIQGADLRHRKAHRKIEFASPQRLNAGTSGHRANKADIDEALRAQ
jgi:hypothetical protein